MGIDEIALRKGQGDYVVVLVDLDKNELVGLAQSRQHKDSKEVLESWGDEVLSQIKEVSIDLSGNYRGLVKRVMPNADIVADRFQGKRISNAIDNWVVSLAGGREKQQREVATYKRHPSRHVSTSA